MIGEAVTYAVGAIVLLGAFFSFTAAVGLVRFPDTYTRIHAAAKAGVVGTGLILLGLALVSADLSVILRTFLGILFLLLTSPISAHLLARAAYSSKTRPADITKINDLEN